MGAGGALRFFLSWSVAPKKKRGETPKQAEKSEKREQPGISQIWITLGVGVGTGTIGVVTSPGGISVAEASERMSSGGITTGDSSGSKPLSYSASFGPEPRVSDLETCSC